jgi:predicted membrane channel-forming protein YqfA (hemolysin III family)
VTLILSSEQLTFTDNNNTLRNSYQSYKYSADKRITTTIPIKDLISINKEMKSGKPLNTVAGVLMFFAAFNQLFLSPFFSSETRKASDRISAGAFGVGLVLAIVPKSKTYHIKQPKEGNKTLWKL